MKQLYKTTLILFSCSLLFLSLAAQPPGDQGLTPRSIGVDESSGNALVNYAKLSEEKEQEVAKLVSLYKDANASQKIALRNQLQAALDELFEINLSKREAELKALEAEIEDIRRGLEFREMNKHKIVENRLRELVDN